MAAQISLTTWNRDVYEPSDDSFALVDALQEQLPSILNRQTPRIVLEVGCGSGFVICSAALALRQAAAGAACSFLAVDINPLALAATAATLAAHQVHGVGLLQADLVRPISQRLDGCVDLLLFNPPYVPTPDEEVERDGIARAWAGGHQGRRVIDRLLPQLPMMLSPGGHCFMVTVQENNPEEIIQQMAAAGLKGSIVLKRGADEESLQIVHLHKPPAA